MVRFGDHAAKEKALQQISQLVQKDNIEEYITEFNDLVSKLSWNRDADTVIERFTDGLHKTVVDRILNYELWPENMDEWQDAARRETRRIILRREKTGGGRSNWNLPVKEARTKYLMEGANKGKKKKEDAAHINAATTTRLNKLTDEERKKLAAEGRCFRCRQKGHRSRECPQKNQQNQKPSEQPAKARIVEVKEEEPTQDEIAELVAKVRALKGKKNDKFFKQIMTAKDASPEISDEEGF